MFSGDICVFCPSVHWLQNILNVCQAYAESHGNVFNCNKTVCMTFKAKSAKSTVTSLLTLGSQMVKYVNHYKYLGIVLNTELADDKDIQRQLRYQYCTANFFWCSNAVKMYFFIPFVSPCMHHNNGVISGSHACRNCVWPMILDAELYTTCPGERVLVAIRFNVNIPTFEALLRKNAYLFLIRCRKSNSCVLWCSQIVCNHPCSLNGTIAFYFMNEHSNISVPVWLMECHVTTRLHFTWTQPV